MHFKRSDGKHNADYALRDLYKEYKNQSKNPVSYKIYSEFLKEYNDRVMHEIIYSALQYKMPYRLGYIRIQRRKLIPYVKEGKLIKKHLPVDYKATKELWAKQYPKLSDEEIKQIPNKKILYHLNEHSGGYGVRFYWDKMISNAINQSCYIFKATRTCKEDLAKFIKDIKIIEYFD